MADIEVHENADGIHWPDATLGSEKYYGILITDFLAEENDTYVSSSWTVPTGLTNMDTDKVGDEFRIKLSADTLGSNYEIICEFSTTEGGNTQTFRQTMLLNVV